MGARDWSEPGHVLAATLTVLRAPLGEMLSRLSEALSELAPHRALAMLTGDCARSPVWTHGEAELTTKVTGAELARLAGMVDIGQPWRGQAVISGATRQVLAVASAPAGSGGALLVLVQDGAGSYGATSYGATSYGATSYGATVQRLWDLAALQIANVVARADPAHLAENRLAAGERARAIAELTDAHALTLTALLATLRSRDLGDAAARRTATDLAVSALIELRAAGDRDRVHSEQSAGDAFCRIADRLSPLTRHSDITLELLGPDQPQRMLPVEIADTARAVSRGAVLTMFEQEGVTRIRIDWQLEDTRLRVTVRDDGPGTLVTDALAVHRLTNRVTVLDGTLRLDAVAGWGSTLTADLPLAPPDLPLADPLARLNPRERDVLEQLARGRRNRQIAEHLHISEHTVKFHVANILGKLDVSSRGEAAATARDAGLVAAS